MQSRAKGLKRGTQAEKREDCGVWETTDRKYVCRLKVKVIIFYSFHRGHE